VAERVALGIVFNQKISESSIEPSPFYFLLHRLRELALDSVSLSR